MTEIALGRDLLTLINVFETTGQTQARLIEILTRAADEEIRHRPGFISANLHASPDGLRVVNYVQWRSADDLRAMLADPACRAHIDEASAIARADARVYEVVAIHRGAHDGHLAERGRLS